MNAKFRIILQFIHLKTFFEVYVSRCISSTSEIREPPVLKRKQNHEDSISKFLHYALVIFCDDMNNYLALIYNYG